MNKPYKKRLKYYNREIFWHETFDEICNLMLKERPYKVIAQVKDDETQEINCDMILSILGIIKDRCEREYYKGITTVEVINGNNYIESFIVRYEFDNEDMKDICIQFNNKFDKKNKQAYLFINKYWLVDRATPNKPMNDSRYMKK